MAVIANSFFSANSRGLVLCIDDAPDILVIAKWRLEKRGYSVMTTQDWHHGLDIVKNEPVDVVILDYEMPGIKGHEVALWIRLAKPDVPIILHSAATDIPGTAKEIMDCCLPKDSDFSLLLMAIAELIMKRRETFDLRQNA